MESLRKKRESNIEIFRIIAMILIVMHHYVVNSGITQLYDLNNNAMNTIGMQIFGAFGKMGINCFTLITGYFMCNKQFTLKKIFKLWGEVIFYRIIINLLFFMFGYSEYFTLKYLVKNIVPFIFNVNNGYTSTMLLMYMLIPFINDLIKTLNQKKHIYLLFILVFVYSIIPTFSVINDTWNYISWLLTMYLVGAYIKMYPCKLFLSTRNALYGCISIILMVLSILFIDYLNFYNISTISYYYMCADANKILPFIGSISLFLLFKNMNIKYCPFINEIATSTFGVLLIHANSDIMRQFLWKDLLKNMEWFNTKFLIFHFFISIVLVYSICTIIDILRIKYVSIPFWKWIDKKISLRTY